MRSHERISILCKGNAFTRFQPNAQSRPLRPNDRLHPMQTISSPHRKERNPTVGSVLCTRGYFGRTVFTTVDRNVQWLCTWYTGEKKSVGMTCCSVQFQHTTQRQIATDVSSGPRNHARNEIAEPSAWHSSNPGVLEAKTGVHVADLLWPPLEEAAFFLRRPCPS